MNSNFKKMRLILIYDIPMTSSEDRLIYTRFHKNITRIGFHMLQFSIYVKSLQNDDTYQNIMNKLKNIVPNKGSVIAFKVTENQYLNMIYLNGVSNKYDKIVGNNNLVVFKGDD